MKKIFYKFTAFLAMMTVVLSTSISLRAADIPITIHINASPWYGGFEGLVLQYEKDTGNKVILDKIPYPGMLEKARNAFAARHDCKNKKDRTKASYWSCNLPRYASMLGLGANMNTFW